MTERHCRLCTAAGGRFGTHDGLCPACAKALDLGVSEKTILAARCRCGASPEHGRVLHFRGCPVFFQSQFP